MYEQRLALERIRFLNDRCFVVEFHAPQMAAAVRPGQFLMLSVGDAIDPLLRRPMAFYDVHTQGDAAVGFAVLIERTGRGTTLLSQLQPGDELDVLGPLGGSFDAPPAGTEALLVMGGVGSAPFPLFARELLGRGHGVRAFIGGRSEQHLLCVQDFQAMGVPVHLATEDGTVGTHGLVTAPLQEYLESAPAVALYSCGPTPMMRAVDRIARGRALPHQVSLEAPMACGIGVCLSCVVPVATDAGWGYRRICREGPVFDAAKLLWEHPDA